MSNYDAIVVGAGNGGLTSAVTMAQKGLKVLLMEKHNVPGGCATTFCRGRFEFETALHQLSGLGTLEQPGILGLMLKKLGVFDKLEWAAEKNLYRIALPNKKLDITLPADFDKLAEVLKENFPAEKNGIDSFIDLIKKIMMQFMGIQFERTGATKEKFPEYFKYALKTFQEVIDEFFTDPNLKLALGIYWCYAGVTPKHWNFSSAALMLGTYIMNKPWHLAGGSQALSNALIDEFLKAGGEVRFNCEVKKILVEDGQVTGVVAESGEVMNCRFVVSNASSIDTYVEFIEQQQVPEKQLEILGGSRPNTSAIILYLGMDCDPAVLGFNEATNFLCMSTDMEKAGLSTKSLEADPEFIMVTCYDAMDIDFSPVKGTSQVTIVVLQYGEPWMTVPPAEYNETKYRIAGKILETVEKFYPGFRGHIEEVEVATPLTVMRYLGTPGGSIYGMEQYTKDSNFIISPQSMIKGLYLAGAWVGEGGFQPSLQSGVSVGNTIVKEFSKG